MEEESPTSESTHFRLCDHLSHQGSQHKLSFSTKLSAVMETLYISAVQYGGY